MIEDPQKKWRALAMVPVIGGLASELLWTVKIAQERHKDKEAHEALEECRDHCR
jgi:hypothetical protein